MAGSLPAWPELLMLVGLLAAAGALAGFVAGLFGVGGGTVVVPTLAWTLAGLGYGDTAMHVAVATSLATIILTSAKSASAHHAKGAVDWDLVKGWAPWVTLGAITGGVMAGMMDAATLKAIFGGVGLLLAAQFAFGNPSWQVAPHPPTGLPRAGVGGVIGWLSAVMGLGGGMFGVTLFTLTGRPIHQAVGTAAALGAAVGLPGAIGFMISGWGKAGLPPGSLGYVNPVIVMVVGALTVSMAGVGARTAHRLDPKRLRRLFAIALALISFNMLRGAF